MSLADYILQAELTVAVENADRFENLVGEFLDRGGFSRLHPAFDAKLLLGLRTSEPVQFFGTKSSAPSNRLRIDNRLREGQDTFQFVNIFSLPDLQDLDLARIMICCADDPLYTSINALVAEEVQNLRTLVKFPRAQPSHGAACQYYRVERQFLLRNLGAYLFGIGACFPALAGDGWKNLGLFQAITGKLNTMGEIWEIPPNASAPDVLTVLQQKHPRLYEVMIQPYPSRYAEGWTMVDAKYAKP